MSHKAFAKQGNINLRVRVEAQRLTDLQNTIINPVNSVFLLALTHFSFSSYSIRTHEPDHGTGTGRRPLALACYCVAPSFFESTASLFPIDQSMGSDLIQSTSVPSKTFNTQTEEHDPAQINELRKEIRMRSGFKVV
jgi:hypothetical protein